MKDIALTIRELFAEYDADEAMQIVQTECTFEKMHLNSEWGRELLQLQNAVVVCSEGDIASLNRLVNRVQKDHRDVLM